MLLDGAYLRIVLQGIGFNSIWIFDLTFGDPVLLGLSPAIREEACEPGVVWHLGAATGWAARQ